MCLHLGIYTRTLADLIDSNSINIWIIFDDGLGPLSHLVFAMNADGKRFVIHTATL